MNRNDIQLQAAKQHLAVTNNYHTRQSCCLLARCHLVIVMIVIKHFTPQMASRFVTPSMIPQNEDSQNRITFKYQISVNQFFKTIFHSKIIIDNLRLLPKTLYICRAISAKRLTNESDVYVLDEYLNEVKK